MTNIRPFVSSC